MMDKLCGLLDEKKELFLEYEQATLAMLDCEPESMANYITERERLANDIDEKSEGIARTCDEYSGDVALRGAIDASADFGALPHEYQQVYYAGQAVRSVMGRILQSEKQVMERMTLLRGEALEKVRQNKDMPKIKKYLTDLTDAPQQGGLRDTKV